MLSDTNDWVTKRSRAFYVPNPCNHKHVVRASTIFAAPHSPWLRDGHAQLSDVSSLSMLLNSSDFRLFQFHSKFENQLLIEDMYYLFWNVCARRWGGGGRVRGG